MGSLRLLIGDGPEGENFTELGVFDLESTGGWSNWDFLTLPGVNVPGSDGQVLPRGEGRSAARPRVDAAVPIDEELLAIGKIDLHALLADAHQRTTRRRPLDHPRLAGRFDWPRRPFARLRPEPAVAETECGRREAAGIAQPGDHDELDARRRVGTGRPLGEQNGEARQEGDHVVVIDRFQQRPEWWAGNIVEILHSARRRLAATAREEENRRVSFPRRHLSPARLPATVPPPHPCSLAGAPARASLLPAAAKSRLDWLVLGLLSLYVAITLTWRGVVQDIAFDESWHVFFGAISPWSKAIQEWARDTHPPLCSLLLKPIVSASHEPIWPRLLSIVPAVLQPYLWFGILRKLGIARPLAYASTVLLAVSHAFSDLGVVIRGYSLAAMFGMAACYWLLDAFPNSQPSRRSLALGIVCAGFAFATEYPAGMALTALSGGLLLVAWFDRGFTASVIRTVREHTEWPERVFAMLAVLGVLGFYGVTFALRDLVNTLRWFPEEGQGFLEYATAGMVLNLHYFSPLDLRDVPGATWIVLAMLAAAAVTGFLLARRDSPLSRRRAVVLFGAVLLVGGTATLGFLRKYPWGGEVRHQYMLVPFLHAVFILGVDEATRAFGRTRWPALISSVAILGLGIWTTLESRAHFDTNEVQRGVLWEDEKSAVFRADETTPVVLPNCSLIGLFAPHRDELDLCFDRSIDRWDVFHGGTPERLVLRPRYFWTVDPVPQEQALVEIRQICRILELDTVRVFASRFDWASVEARQRMRPEAERAARAVGLELSERQVWEFGETMRIRMAP